jgi:hypothetical protein
MIQRGQKGKALGDSIMVKTDLFEHREVKPHFISPCCFGEDFAAWLKQELLRFADLDFELSEATQEDYGWGFWASRGKDRFWVAISYVGDGPQETPAEWVISIVYDPGFNLVKRMFHKPDTHALERLRNHVREIITSNGTIKLIKA